MLRGQLVPEGNGEGGLLGVGKALFLDWRWLHGHRSVFILWKACAL